MSTRKKQPALQIKQTPAPPACVGAVPDLASLLMIGNEQVVVDEEEDPNLHFMAEFVDLA